MRARAAAAFLLAWRTLSASTRRTERRAAYNILPRFSRWRFYLTLRSAPTIVRTAPQLHAAARAGACIYSGAHVCCLVRFGSACSPLRLPPPSHEHTPVRARARSSGSCCARALRTTRAFSASENLLLALVDPAMPPYNISMVGSAAASSSFLYGIVRVWWVLMRTPPHLRNLRLGSITPAPAPHPHLSHYHGILFLCFCACAFSSCCCWLSLLGILPGER